MTDRNDDATTEPIKIQWEGEARSKFKGRKVLARKSDGEEEGRLAYETLDRLKTRVVVETEEEAVALEEMLDIMAGTKYRWTTASHVKAYQRVLSTLREEMDKRGWDDEDEDEEETGRQLADDLSEVEEVKSIGRKKGTADVTVSYMGEPEDSPEEVVSIAEEYDRTIVVRESGRYGLGLETTVALVGEDRLEEIEEFESSYGNEVETLERSDIEEDLDSDDESDEDEPVVATDGGSPEVDLETALDAVGFEVETADGVTLELVSVDDQLADRDAWVDGRHGGTRKHYTLEGEAEDGLTKVYHATVEAPPRSERATFSLSLAQQFTEDLDGDEPIEVVEVVPVSEDDEDEEDGSDDDSDDEDPEVRTDGGVRQRSRDPSSTPLEALAAADERLRVGNSPGATLVLESGERWSVELVMIEALVESDEPLADIARGFGLVRWGRYEAIEAARSGVVAEDESGETYHLKLRDGDLVLESCELKTPLADGGAFREDPAAEWCPECQRQRIDCRHRSRATDGGTKPSGSRPGRMGDRADELSERTILSPQEAKVQELKEEGLSHSQIAERLDLAKGTVDRYSTRINERLDRARATLEELVEDVDEPDCIYCGEPVNPLEPGYYKSDGEKFAHSECVSEHSNEDDEDEPEAMTDGGMTPEEAQEAGKEVCMRCGVVLEDSEDIEDHSCETPDIDSDETITPHGATETVSVEFEDGSLGEVDLETVADLARGELVAVDRETLKQVADLANARVQDDLSRHSDPADVPGYDPDRALTALDDLGESLEK